MKSYDMTLVQKDLIRPFYLKLAQIPRSERSEILKHVFSDLVNFKRNNLSDNFSLRSLKFDGEVIEELHNGNIIARVQLPRTHEPEYIYLKIINKVPSMSVEEDIFAMKFSDFLFMYVKDIKLIKEIVNKLYLYLL